MQKRIIRLLPLVVFLGAGLWFVYTKCKAASLNQAICVAASKGDTAAVEQLLKRGANPNAVAVVPDLDCDCVPDALPVLLLAIDRPYEEHLDTVAMLLQAGADANTSADDGFTALTLSRSPRMVKLLLSHGAKVDMRDKFGNTALISSADNSNKDVLKAFIVAGADVNARNNQGKTAYGYALEWGDKESIRLLKNAGAHL